MTRFKCQTEWRLSFKWLALCRAGTWIQFVDDLTGRGFGLIIAYVLPGYVALIGMSPFSELVRSWLMAALSADTGVAGFLHLTTASLCLGMLGGCFRWIVVDTVNSWTGLRRPVWDDQRLTERLSAFNLIVEHHYRYYQFYGSTLLILPVVYWTNRQAQHSLLGPWTDVLLLITEAVLFAAARDALRTYFRRALILLGPHDCIEGTKHMTNGSHPEAGGTAPKAATNKPISAPAPKHPKPLKPKSNRS